MYQACLAGPVEKRLQRLASAVFISFFIYFFFRIFFSIPAGDFRQEKEMNCGGESIRMQELRKCSGLAHVPCKLQQIVHELKVDPFLFLLCRQGSRMK